VAVSQEDSLHGSILFERKGFSI